jgi:hypothetical protein
MCITSVTAAVPTDNVPFAKPVSTDTTLAGHTRLCRSFNYKTLKLRVQFLNTRNVASVLLQKCVQPKTNKVSDTTLTEPCSATRLAPSNPHHPRSLLTAQPFRPF